MHRALTGASFSVTMTTSILDISKRARCLDGCCEVSSACLRLKRWILSERVDGCSL